MISARNITMMVNGKKLLDDVNIDVEPATFTAIAGPNGAGKSTLLKILSNEQKRYEGRVFINGFRVRVYDIAELSKIRAVLPQSTNLQFPFTVKQIVQMGAPYRKNTRQQNEKIDNEVMELTGVSAWQDRNYLTLSGGEQQRVSLARVLAQVWELKPYPRYILLDEPTSNLDIAQQQLIFQLVKQACDRNIGVLAIVHDLNQVAQFVDKLYFLRAGSIVAHGALKEVFTKAVIEETFGWPVQIFHDSATNYPFIVPEKISPFNQSPLKTINL